MPQVRLVRGTRRAIVNADHYNAQHLHTMINFAITYLCLVGIISGVIVRFSVSKHIDKERMIDLDDPSRAFSLLGPSYEVLTEKGKRLLTMSYVLFGGGFLLPFVVDTFQRFLR